MCVCVCVSCVVPVIKCTKLQICLPKSTCVAILITLLLSKYILIIVVADRAKIASGQQLVQDLFQTA